MKNCLLRSFQAILVFSLAFTLTNCGNLDNPLEELGGGGGGGSAVSVTGISLDQTTLSMQAGDKGQLTATVAPDNATDKTVTWSSDKEEIATVDANGLVTAVAMGTAIITAKAGDKKATCEVTVTPGLATPLTVEAITAGTITVSTPQSGMKYSKDGGVTKLPVSANPTNIPVAAGEKVAFYGTDPIVTNYYQTYIRGTDDGFKCKVYGNIMSLLYEDFATNYNTLPAATNTFRSLFNGNAKLTDASGLLLPAKTLANSCYYQMFFNCTNLAAAPKELPAQTLAANCYSYMFENCEALTETPKLPAETANLADNCYESMFRNCTSLTTAYVKAAYDPYHNRCYNMFEGCTATGTKTLHTTTASKTSWDTVMPSTWAGWTAVDDWTD